VTRINRVEIGMRATPTSTMFSGGSEVVRDVAEESLMLTGDENIVDVDFIVFWTIKDAAAYLFNIQNPQSTVKDVAESAMREIVGQNDIQPILTKNRRETEDAVRNLMQRTLDSYTAGIQITQVQLQKVDPPAQVIDAFRDVQAARADQERLQNEADAYANRIVPEARGQAQVVLQGAQAYREQVIAEAKGQTDRFLKVYEEYSKAPDVTRQRMFLETMERVLGGTDKVIIDDRAGGQGVVPYLPLNELRRTPQQQPQRGGGGQ
jgi:membrane protease subunit HflK